MYHVFLYKDNKIIGSDFEEFDSTLCHLWEDDFNRLTVDVVPSCGNIPEHILLRTKIYTDEAIPKVIQSAIDAVGLIGLKWRCFKELPNANFAPI